MRDKMQGVSPFFGEGCPLAMQKIADSHSKIRQKSRKYRETVAGQWNLNRFHHAQIRCESNFKHGSEQGVCEHI